MNQLHRFLLLIVLVFMATGCKQPRAVVLEAQADPEYQLPRAAVVAISTGTADLPTLPERALATSVEDAARDAGFTVVNDRSQADFVLFCGERTYEREYETVRYIPVHESTFGSYYTDGGYRHFDAHTHSNVVVPVRRVETLGVISIFAARRDDVDQMGSDPETVERIARWIGTVSTNAVPLRSDRRWHVRKLLGYWGRDGYAVIDGDDPGE